MTLATITAFIDAKIRNKTPKVIKTEHADVEQTLANLLFPVLLEETNVAHTITSLNDAKFIYNLFFKKVGNIVYVKGHIISVYNGTIVSANIIEITDLEFSPKAGEQFILLSRNDSIGESTKLLVAGNYITLPSYSAIAAYQQIAIDSYYHTND